MIAMLHDRKVAGRDLARRLLKYKKCRDVVVFAVPRGGVPVAAEIAHALHAPLDFIVVRKLAAIGHDELAIGAIANGGVRVINPEVVRALQIPHRVIEVITAREMPELERRERLYRGDHPQTDIEDKRVILVDDGLATGTTMHAAVAALRSRGPAKVIAAIPVAPFQPLKALRREVDEVACLATPEPFDTISQWYARFPQLSDVQVCSTLAERWAEESKNVLA